MSHCGTNAVIASVASSYNNNILSLGVYIIPVLQTGVEQGSGVQLEMVVKLQLQHRGNFKFSYLQIFHGKVDTIGLPVGDLEVTRPGCPCTNNKCVEFLSQCGDVNINSDVYFRDECLICR